MAGLQSVASEAAGTLRIRVDGLPLIDAAPVDVSVRALAASFREKLHQAEAKQYALISEARLAAKREIERVVGAVRSALRKESAAAVEVMRREAQNEELELRLMKTEATAEVNIVPPKDWSKRGHAGVIECMNDEEVKIGHAGGVLTVDKATYTDWRGGGDPEREVVRDVTEKARALVVDGQIRISGRGGLASRLDVPEYNMPLHPPFKLEYTIWYEPPAVSSVEAQGVATDVKKAKAIVAAEASMAIRRAEEEVQRKLDAAKDALKALDAQEALRAEVKKMEEEVVAVNRRAAQAEAEAQQAKEEAAAQVKAAHEAAAKEIKAARDEAEAKVNAANERVNQTADFARKALLTALVPDVQCEEEQVPRNGPLLTWSVPGVGCELNEFIRSSVQRYEIQALRDGEWLALESETVSSQWLAEKKRLANEQQLRKGLIGVHVPGSPSPMRVRA
eukprot:2701220-Prymnesium_polylepis.1